MYLLYDLLGVGVLVLQIFNSDFFYDRILRTDKTVLSETLDEKGSFYYMATIPKKGGVRVLNCLQEGSHLYNLQRNVVTQFLSNIPIADNCFGFVKGSSYRDYLLCHRKLSKEKRYYLRIDISNFFNSITSDIIQERMSQYFQIADETENDDAISVFTDIVTLDNTLPQGAVTSPILSNVIFRKIDLRVYKYCKKLGVTYSRYADDLLFSAPNYKLHKSFFLKTISAILASEGFDLNRSKTVKSIDQISLNGFVVARGVTLSRRRLSDINRVLFCFHKGGKPKSVQEYLDRLNGEYYLFRKKKWGKFFYTKESIVHYLAGYRSFCIQWISNDNSLSQLLRRIEELIRLLEPLK